MRRNKNIHNETIADACKINTVLFTFRFLNFFLLVLKSLLFRQCAHPSRILIFRTGSLGDSICAIPTIAAIRKKYHTSQIDILTNPGKAEATLISIDQLLSPSLYNNVINYFGWSVRKTLAVLRKQKYNLIIQLPQTDANFWGLVRDLLFYRLIASAGWGWKLDRIFFFRKTQEKYLLYDREVVRLAKIAASNHITVDVDEFPLNITVQDNNFVKSIFDQSGVTGRKIIGVCIGAKRPQNRWPLKSFMAVINHFAADYNIVIIGGMEDQERAAPIAAHPHVFNFCGSFTPMQSAAAFTNCCVVLSNDTGPMHLSYAVGTPTVALFSSRDFKGAWFPPENGKNIVFRSENIHCALCMSDNCKDNICMQGIYPSQVIAAITQRASKPLSKNLTIADKK